MEKRKYYGGTDGANTYYFFILEPFVNAGHQRTDLGGWKFEEEPWVGSFYFSKGDVAVYATPFWEGTDGVDFFATNDLGDELASCKFDLTPTGDSRADVKAYFDVVVKFLKIHNLY